MAQTQTETDLQIQLTKLKAGIREVAHELNNPLGVMRMALYMMQVHNNDQAKREHYLELLHASIERIEAGIKRLRALRENIPVAPDDAPPSTTSV